MKIRLSDARAVCGKPIGYLPTDTRTADVINRACERLLEGLMAKGTVLRYRVCVNNSCLVLPRQIETVEAFAIEGCPGVVRGPWWDFLGTGPGVQCADGCYNGQLIMGDEVASFDNVTGTGKKLAIYATQNETAGAVVTLRYYDANGQWVRTQVSSQWIDGEQLTIPAAGGYTYTASECMPNGFVAAIKPVTNGMIRLYEYDPNTLALKPLAYWESDETIPQYRSALVPGLTGLASSNSGGTCAKCTIVIRGKARFIPVRNDDDFLQIESIEAVRLGCQAVSKEEKDLIAEAAGYWQMAFAVLDKQLSHYQGHAAQQPIQIQNVGMETAPANIG